MKKHTLKLNQIVMGYFARWVVMAISEIDDDTLILEKLVISDLYYRNMQKFEMPEKTSLRISLHEALALSRWLEGLELADSYANMVCLQVYEQISKPLNDQICTLKKRHRSIVRTGYAASS
jgi:hypothetical protein